MNRLFLVLVIAACLTSICARPENAASGDHDDNRTLVSSSFFSTSDGIHHQATGEMQNIGTQEEALKGVYSYIAPDGTAYEVEYTADDKGFRPHVKILPPTVLRIDAACVGSLCGTGLG